MAHYHPQIKVGYLGGGQLARMLAQSASRLGLLPHVFSEKQDDPAAQVCGQWKQGQLNDKASLEAFLTQVDVATFESEFLDAKLLSEVSLKTGSLIFPSPHLMGELQDRLTQKKHLDSNHLATAPWRVVDTQEDIEIFVSKYGFPVVFKKRTFGYDGYGTFIVDNEDELNQFISNVFKDNLFIVEKGIDFKRELAIIVARSRDGSFTHLPFVESFQKEARCDWVMGPVKAPQAKRWVSDLENFLQHLDYVGVMGIEFFDTGKKLLINEIAPRVHNTGHYSESAPGYSQFDLHNMCLLGQTLPQPTKWKDSGFAMANLIGQGGEVKLKSFSGLHWYGKTENRVGRKMGHVNALASSSKKALKKALEKRGGIQL